MLKALPAKSQNSPILQALTARHPAWCALAAMLGILAKLPEMVEDMREFHRLVSGARANELHNPLLAGSLRGKALSLFATH